MRLHFIHLLGFAVVEGALASKCCDNLAQSLGQAVKFPNATGYADTLAGYWSIQESSIKPACVLQPATAQDVAEAVSVIGAVDDCNFAVKGGGHAPAAGFANAKDGVTIDMTGLASVSLNEDRSVAKVGAGAKWLDVYRHLDGTGVQVAGGRNGNVGVGGLLVGGGISHFTTSVGWACDLVVNYEIVLADGSLVNASKDQNPDLFLALKGGANNYGVVTRYDLATFPQGEDISVTSVSYDIAQRGAVFAAFTDLLDSSTYDPRASLVMGLLYSSESKTWKLSNSAVYSEPVAQPAVFEKLVSVPNLSIERNITTLAEFADETKTPPLNWLFATETFKPSAEHMLELFTTLNETISSFNPEGGVKWSIAFEPLVAAMLPEAHGLKKNVLGLESAQDGYIVLVSALWPNSSVEPDVSRTVQGLISEWESLARERGLLQGYQYLNYAATFQHPLESYGAENLEFLRGVSRKYDPMRVMQDRVGGFKL